MIGNGHAASTLHLIATFSGRNDDGTSFDKKLDFKRFTGENNSIIDIANQYPHYHSNIAPVKISNGKLTVHYTANDAKLTVKFIDADNNKSLIDNQILTKATVGGHYHLKNLNIDGYHLDDLQQTDGIINDENQLITLKYYKINNKNKDDNQKEQEKSNDSSNDPKHNDDSKADGSHQSDHQNDSNMNDKDNEPKNHNNDDFSNQKKNDDKRNQEKNDNQNKENNHDTSNSNSNQHDLKPSSKNDDKIPNVNYSFNYYDIPTVKHSLINLILVHNHKWRHFKVIELNLFKTSYFNYKYYQSLKFKPSHRHQFKSFKHLIFKLNQ